MYWFCALFLSLVMDLSAASSLGRCRFPYIHARTSKYDLHFSWRGSRKETFSWARARIYCNSVCMMPLTIESDEQWSKVQEILKKEPVNATWTDGRKCNYEGCHHAALQPPISNGWFWATEKKRLPNPFRHVCTYCAWSSKGSLSGPQPDNREGIEDGVDEACLAVLENFYGDGIKWHDVACHHTKPIICQREKGFINTPAFLQIDD